MAQTKILVSRRLTQIYKYAKKLISKDKISKAKKVPTSYQPSVLSGTLLSSWCLDCHLVHKLGISRYRFKSFCIYSLWLSLRQ